MTSPHLRKRHRKSERFRYYGIAAVCMSALLLLILIGSVVMPGLRGFTQPQIAVTLADGDALSLVNIQKAMLQMVANNADRATKRALFSLVTTSAVTMAHRDKADNNTLWIPASDKAAYYLKGLMDESLPAYARGLTDQQIEWLKQMRDSGKTRISFNWDLFQRGDSRMPEKAGFGGSVIGSLLMILICMGVAFPVGILAAVYLEEFSRKGKIRDLIEVTINNLAAVPSIVFGLLGLSVFLLFFGLPRSSPLVGGLTLALMVLPVIIISTRVSLQSIPPSIREAALALGASPLQAVFHHVVPLAMPGIMTGTILSVARALGETAPLIMIGMVAFIADIPHIFTDPATTMPVQVYIWASSPERGFIDKTASGILLLLIVLLLLNAVAIFLRKRYEVRW
ncbi:MAG: phosphate ABC transporter permease PstA [Rickettsiales bacterium]